MMKLIMTGGHHSSALPIIKKLRKEQDDASQNKEAEA